MATGPNIHRWKPLEPKVHSFPWIAQGLGPPGVRHGREKRRPNSSLSFPAAEWSVTCRGAVNCNMLKSSNALGLLKKLKPLKIHNFHMVAHLLESPLTSPRVRSESPVGFQSSRLELDMFNFLCYLLIRFSLSLISHLWYS